MDFIRESQTYSSHDLNTSHCISGPDADLIMLCLAIHLPNTHILREDFSIMRPVKCQLCEQIGHDFKNCQGLPKGGFKPVPSSVFKTQYLFVKIDILREYLERDFLSLQLPFDFDLERAIDDWVFLCFFVGNDFLPHLPSINIYEGAVNRLIGIYKTVAHEITG